MSLEDLLPKKTFTSLVQEGIKYAKSVGVKITNFNIGGVYRTLIEIPMQAISELYSLLPGILKQTYMHMATGGWADLKAAEYRINRKESLPTKGQVFMARDNYGEDVKIPKDSIIKITVLGEERRFFVEDDVLLLAGLSEVAVPVIAEFEGSDYNALATENWEMVTHIPGIDKIYTRADWITREGTNAESDDDLRNRALGRWDALAYGGTDDKYISICKEVNGIEDVKIVDGDPRGRGTVDIYITSVSGSPSEDLLAECQSKINYRKDLCADVLVQAASSAPVDMDIVIYYDSMYGDEKLIRDQALVIMSKIFRSVALEVEDSNFYRTSLGKPLLLAPIIGQMIRIENVVNVKFNTPSNDVLVNENEIPIAGEIKIQVFPYE